jgi:putative membrane protein insertion efficiency factor
MPRSANFAPVDAVLATTPTAGVRAAVAVVRAYQLLLSPFAGGACRFTPSCSAYAIDALNQHGVWRGGWLALKRVSRCHPLGSSGIDPVPPVE